MSRDGSVASNALSPRDLALFGLYVTIPPRRIRDYNLMRVTTEGDGDEDDKRSNWLVLGDGGQPVKMVIHRYKTSKRYGTYTRRVIPKALANALANYVHSADIADGEPLFPTTKGKPYTSGAFSALVGSLFKRITGQRSGVNILRHSAITNFLSKKRTVARKEAYAKEMAHSTGMQALYDRVDAGAHAADLSSDDDDDDAPTVAPAVAPKKAVKKAPTKKAKPATRTTTKGRVVKTPAKYQ